MLITISWIKYLKALMKKNVLYIKYGISLNLTCSFKRPGTQAYISRSSNRLRCQKMNQHYCLNSMIRMKD